jgi:ABC-type nitrate/sulfonate/bicarbonate transport system substrate-binding protein
VQVGLEIPSVWVIHPAYAKSHPDVAVRWLRATLDGAEWAAQDRARTAALYKRWDQFRGTQTPDDILNEEVDLAMGLWPLKTQLEKMKGKPGEAKPYVYRALEDIAKFYIRIGRMKEMPDIAAMIDTSWLDKAAALPAR